MRWWIPGEEDPRELAEKNVEVWVLVDPDAPNYAVSNYGRAASCARGEWRMMTLSVVGSGYVAFNFPKGLVSGLAHRVVIQAFDGPPPTPQHTDVRHLDGIKANNNLTNLRWGTRSENMLDVVRHREAVGAAEQERQIEEAQANGTWHGGRSWDASLVEVLLHLESEGRIRLVDVAKILAVSDDVVRRLVRASSRPRELTKQTRRSPVLREQILGLLAEGCGLSEINDRLGENLSHQDLYYYRQIFRAQGGTPPRQRQLTGSAHPGTKFDEAKLTEAFTAVIDGTITSVAEFGSFLGISQGITYSILRGDKWTHVPRPDGWEDALRRLMPRYKRPTPKPKEEAL